MITCAARRDRAVERSRRRAEKPGRPAQAEERRSARTEGAQVSQRNTLDHIRDRRQYVHLANYCDDVQLMSRIL